LEQVLRADPKNVRANYVLGLLLLNNGRPREALPHFAIAGGNASSDAYAAYYVARCSAEGGSPSAALAAYQRAFRLDPLLRSAAYGAFQMLQRLGRNAEAEQMLARFRALELDPRSSVAEFKYTRMGPLGQAITIDAPARTARPGPAGAVFEQS